MYDDRWLRVMITALLTLMLLVLLNTWPVRAEPMQHGTVKPTSAVPGEKYRACILHRESRGDYTVAGPGGSGAYQFTQATWNITAKRAGWRHLVNVRPNHAPPATQDAMYWAAWEQGNGKFYWSARWSPGTYACFPGDVAKVPSQWR